TETLGFVHREPKILALGPSPISQFVMHIYKQTLYIHYIYNLTIDSTIRLVEPFYRITTNY
ncbi:hypothetical protein BLOT_011858, partial [Blomia tropicalis]